MKTVRISCRNCGFEDKQDVLTEREQLDSRIPRRPVACRRCGSQIVEVR